MPVIRRPSSIVLALLVAAPATAAAQGNPFLPPQAKAHYARSRDYHLRTIVLHLKLDWPHRTYAGTVRHTVSPLRNGLAHLDFDAGKALDIRSCSVDGSPARFTREGEVLSIATRPLPRGRDVTVDISYNSKPPQRGRQSLNGSYGFHWIEPDPWEPARRPAFYTQGETEGNHEWVPIYDYPNDKATSEVYVEAPATWFVVGDGALVGTTPGSTSATRIFHWKMTQPHATYLLSLAGGEMDVATDTWRGIRLYYCVPKGEGRFIPASFGDTKDMLSFFSDRLGFKFPWPKYAQTCMFDFGGGMENVSATTLGEGSLVEKRNGVWPMADLNSHEMSHQWFGDTVTTRDWGDIWLNEGFATFFEQLYAEHAFGEDRYDAEREGAMNSYLNESRRYKRSIVTPYFPSPDAMFDSHTYPKGGLVLHMLRRELGDDDFFRGLGDYLRAHAYRSVDTHDLMRSLEASTGRSLDGFFDQWLYKPGHPVVDYHWSYDDSGKQVVLGVSQLQDTKDGTPVYTIAIPVALIHGSTVERTTVSLNAAKQDFMLPVSSKPDAVLLDPGHDILMERRPHTWQPGEAEVVMRAAPCFLDRRDAAISLLSGSPSDDTVRAAAESCLSQLTTHPMYADAVLNRLGELKRPELRPTFEKVITAIQTTDGAALGPVGSLEACAAAIRALGKLPRTGADSDAVRDRVAESEMFPVEEAAIATLADWDADGNIPTFRKALGIDSRHEVVRIAALNALGRCTSDAGMALVVEYTSRGRDRRVREQAEYVLGHSFLANHAATTALITLIDDPDPQVARDAVSDLRERGDATAVPILRSVAADTKRSEELRDAARGAADHIEGK